MKTASAKAKGRTLQNLVVQKLRKTFGWEDDDCTGRSMGASGEDVLLSPRARRDFPFSIECKNTERLSIYNAYDQARDNGNDHIPCVVHKRNRREPLIIIGLDDFLRYIRNEI